MAEQKEILVSGVKPTGDVHIGNYFGAMRQFVDLQEAYNPFLFIANYHALTGTQNAELLEENTLNVACDYLAIGLDLDKTTLFLQSDIPEVTELAWIFNCITTMPYLSRAHAFKDAEVKSKEVNVGTFDYPVLMAADILLFDANIVPVGQDQKQHLEMARDIAEKFNKTFGETFKIPEPYILEDVQTVPGTDGQKMSKSYKNTVPLFGTKKEIEKAVMSIVTDSGDTSEDIPAKNIFAIHKLFKDDDELTAFYKENTDNYKEIKERLIEDIDTFVAPLRDKRDALVKNPDEVKTILKNGGEIARSIAKKKMMDVRKKVGLGIS